MLGEIIADLSNWMYTYLLVILLVAAGLFFTIRNRFPQLRLLREAIRVVVERPEKEGSVSSFQALMVSTASRVGTGNIIGVSVAICMGGYGAVFWMWLIALLGGATAFTESTLAQIYKRRNPETGESYGGPAYYIEAALQPSLAVLFAQSLIATLRRRLNALLHNLQSTFSDTAFIPGGTPDHGGIVALLTGYCVMGGGKRIIAFASTLVPIMGGLYVLVALVVIVMNVGLIPQVFGRIFSEAFDFQAIFAGFTGSAVMQGVKRGLFSNEAGVGSAPNAAASANVSHPVKQGLVQMLSVFLDTLVICSATAFMLLCSGVEPAVELQGAPYVQSALAASFGTLGPVFITVAMVLFAFTTLIGNLYYVDNALAYLLGHVPSKRFMVVFRLIAMGLIFLGAGLTLDLVWNLSDVLMGVMVLINIPVIAVLSRPAAAALRNYTEQRRAGKNPVFRAADIDLKEKTEYWN
ncbi:MAG: alanine/glycine:cation symporter family protein [Dysosmobacter welbionis]